MKKTSQILLLLISSFVFPQKQFTIKLTAPAFEKDSLLLVPPSSSRNILSLYNLNVQPDKSVSSIANAKGALIRIQPQNTISGTIPCPLPMMFMAPKEDGKSFSQSKLFFIEEGLLKIKINDQDLSLVLSGDASVNNDYNTLKEYLLEADGKLKPFEKNDPADIESKGKLLQAYIKKHPGSYPAFWEIVNDLSKYGFYKIYLNNLPLFSNKVKTSSCFKNFEKILSLENSTDVGGSFPEINFGSEGKITKAGFADYKITLVDYWSTACKPCIQELPELVKMYEKYKDKGVNFISIADDRTQQRIDLGHKIFKENKVLWKNYFDINKEFPRKLNAAGYPLFILVDRNGKIISRELGGQENLETIIEQYLK